MNANYNSTAALLLMPVDIYCYYILSNISITFILLLYYIWQKSDSSTNGSFQTEVQSVFITFVHQTTVNVSEDTTLIFRYNQTSVSKHMPRGYWKAFWKVKYVSCLNFLCFLLHFWVINSYSFRLILVRSLVLNEEIDSFDPCGLCLVI